MPIQIDESRSKAYIGTFDKDSTSDMNDLKQLRIMVRNMNMMLNESNFDYQFRVKLVTNKHKKLDAFIYKR